MKTFLFNMLYFTCAVVGLYYGEASRPALLFYFLNVANAIFTYAMATVGVIALCCALSKEPEKLIEWREKERNWGKSFFKRLRRAFYQILDALLILALAGNGWYFSAIILLSAMVPVPLVKWIMTASANTYEQEKAKKS